MAISIEERVARLEDILEQINIRLDSIDRRLNTLTTVMVGTWITTIITIIAVGAAIYFKL